MNLTSAYWQGDERALLARGSVFFASLALAFSAVGLPVAVFSAISIPAISIPAISIPAISIPAISPPLMPSADRAFP